MITLFAFPPAFGQSSSSPFCVKAEYLLNMSGRKWRRKDIADPRKMPHGKLPVIEADGQMIADSDRIQSWLKDQGADFNAGLSDLDRANARAFIRMADEHLYFCLALERWGNDTIWPIVRDTYFSSMPGGLRHVFAGAIRRQVLSGLHHQGLGRMTEAERLTRISSDLDAIATRLDHSSFLFGENPTAADASVASMLAAAVATPGKTALKSRIAGNDRLTNYVARVDATCG